MSDLTSRERLIVREALAIAIDEYDGSAVGFGPLVSEAKILRANLENQDGS